MNSFRTLVVLGAVFSTVSANLYNMPDWRSKGAKTDETINIRGKKFQKNGSSKMSALSDREALIYRQCMNQSDSSCSKKWDQRYWVNTDYYQDGGPVFFMLGAEAPADGSVDMFYWLNYAAQYNAVLVCLEHRFYGKSIPTRDTSYKSLQLLTSQQALADGARFIKDFKNNNGYANAPVVVFGGSYGGNLAAWFREKYPQSANVAVASSGPLEAQFDFTGYMKTVSEVIYWNNPTCFFQIRDVFTCIENLIHGRACANSTTKNKSGISKALQQCYNTDFNDQRSIDYFFRWLAMNMWASNYPNKENKDKCLTLNKYTGKDPLANYGKFLTAMGQGGCPNGPQSNSMASSRDDEVKNFINSEEGIYSGAAGWYWQTCYEFGYYQTADPTYLAFGYEFTPRTYVDECQNQYGTRFTADFIKNQIVQTNNYYKGRNKDVGSCVIFVNGDYDPWHSLGINKAEETNSNNYVVSIPTGEHCADMGYGNEAKSAQAKIQAQIGTFLADPKCYQ